MPYSGRWILGNGTVIHERRSIVDNIIGLEMLYSSTVILSIWCKVNQSSLVKTVDAGQVYYLSVTISPTFYIVTHRFIKEFYSGVQACSYPGTAIAGRMSSVKFYYTIGENITFTCDAGLELRGAKMLKCQKNGKWSNAIPTCVSPDPSARSDNREHFWMTKDYD